MACAAGLLALVPSAHGQGVPVSFAPPEGLAGSVSSAAGAGNCLAVGPSGTSSNISFVGGDTTQVRVFVNSDGQNYGVRGGYTATPPNCSSLSASEQPLCESISSAFTQAVAAANAQSGFPQGTMTAAGSGYGSGDSVSLQFGAGVCGTRGTSAIPMCENTITFPNMNGGSSVHSFIYFDTDSLSNSTGSTEFGAATFEDNASFANCDVAHELTHTFGLDDTYTGEQNVPGLMGGGECTDILSGAKSDPYPNYWLPNEKAAVDWLNAGKAVVVNNADSCGYACPDGEVMSFSQATPGSGPFTVSCEATSAQSSNDLSCTCDSSSPYCTDVNTQQTVSPPEGVCAPAATVSCSCSGMDLTCVDGDGNPAVPPLGTACEQAAPVGATCECVYSGSTVTSVSCTDTDGNVIPVPSDFSCAPSTGEDVGGYVCSEDNQCTYEANPPGGSEVYGSESDCNAACIPAETDPYECVSDGNSSVCSYVGVGGTFPDLSSCNASCGS